MAERRNTSSRKRVYCPHCEEHISRSHFYQHKHLYYDENLQDWRCDRSVQHTEQDVFYEFSPSNSPIDYTSLGEDGLSQDELDDFHLDSSDDESQSISASDPDEILDESSNEESELEFEEVNMEMNDDESGVQYRRVVHVLLLFLFLWQSLFRISDGAISLMLSFIMKFFLLAGMCLQLDALNKLGHAFPATLYHARKFLGRIQEQFKRYVSCPSCHKLYAFDNCWIVAGPHNKLVSLECSFKQYPNHLQSRMRAPCGQKLLKTVRSSNGTEFLAPYQTYCFKSVSRSLEELFNKPNYLQLCESWRNKRRESGKLCDIYDGQMWKHFQFDQNGFPFLTAPYNYLLMLNCDWFQPFKHTQFSVGVLYLAVENLPRDLRFKRENILVVGIIPGPSEPSLNINTYLKPMIDDLQQLWFGVTIKINGESKTIRAALSCLACDVPAARKVGGFVGHRGRRGCSRCSKDFPTRSFGDIPDYSGFNKSEWEPRSHALHVWYAQKQEIARTEVERKAVESMYGACYTSLYELPYYNAVSSCIIDPMHCLFLGIAKHFFKVWVSNNILSDKDLPTIQKKVNSFKCPPDIGRIPYKIASKCSGLKADQWKSWTLYFSLFSLKDILPHRDYDCWLMFVKVCSKICRRNIDVAELDSIDEGIQDFCQKFENLYGKQSLTPNMHLVAHITDCIRDHGPVYGFWLYAFERMNGVLGSFQTSNHNVTVQLMRKFLSMQLVSLDQWPEEFKNEIGPLFHPYFKESGSLSETACPNEITHNVKPLPPISEKAFQPNELSEVETLSAIKASVTSDRGRCSVLDYEYN